MKDTDKKQEPVSESLYDRLVAEREAEENAAPAPENGKKQRTKKKKKPQEPAAKAVKKKAEDWDPKKSSKTLQKIMTVLKSALSLVSLFLLATVFIFFGDDMFGMFLLIPTAACAAAAYLFSAVCLMMNFFSTKLYSKQWNIASLVSILILGLVMTLGLTVEITGFTYYLCICIAVQCLPSVIEMYELEKKRAEKKKTGQ